MATISSTANPLAHDNDSGNTATLAARLDISTVVGQLVRVENGKLRCVACGHRCLLAEGRRGVCKVRFNQGGVLKVPFGYTAGMACDPIEKKPFFHVYPGGDALTFGMLGCDFHCAYCQNWMTSQALRDPIAGVPVRPVTPAQIVSAAIRENAKLVVSSYNEPLITAEWAHAVFETAMDRGLKCAFVSNGNATPEVLDYLQPCLAAYKVDLKTFNESHYRSLGGKLTTVLETIQMLHQRGIWLEVLTLVVPGFNDTSEELHNIARFVASVSRDIPWHVTAFHPDYQMTGPAYTMAADLVRAAEIGAEAGLHYVYTGNMPGGTGEWENTRCPVCHETLVRRQGYHVHDYCLTPTGQCPKCNTRIPGIWHSVSL
jgi:pyruvate formate lyase activating enzyme